MNKYVFSKIYTCKNLGLHILARLKTIIWYRIFFGQIGSKSTFYTPIRLINPQNVFLGNRVCLYKGSRIEALQIPGRKVPKIQIGDGTSFEQSLHMTCAEAITIGCETVVSANVLITDIDHQYTEIRKNVSRQPLIPQSVLIGDFCFIGMGAKIFPGTKLGDSCVVGADSIVRGEFPDFSVLVGTPAKVIKRYDTVFGVWRKTRDNGDFLENNTEL